jgi:hypothetical protein
MKSIFMKAYRSFEKKNYKEKEMILNVNPFTQKTG